MARLSPPLAALALAALSVGCMSNKIKTLAANDMQCSFGQVQIADLDNGAFRATGCGQTVDYYCNTKACVRAGGGGEADGAEKAKKPSKAKDDESAGDGFRWVKKGPAKFKLKADFVKDGDADVYKDADAHHVVKIKSTTTKTSDDEYFDANYPEGKRFADGGVKMTTKMDGGGSRRLTVAVVVRDGKAWELSCTFEDAASTKTDPVCLDVLKSFKVAAPEGEE
jgi:hypothetical protein